ncbi:hypothetical protein [Acinetobacter towneri]|uniref:DUF3185 family protein n=1 Tax=Acinetobacter towneri TaxID=202956 RepID=A0ABX7THF2_9GAMM|nr:hypothetical protein [Acinetobacter towneri]QTD62683.1 hypothetical protein J4G45_05890 [Acinetobacter towneri]
MTQLFAYLIFIVGLLVMMLGGLGLGAYWGLSNYDEANPCPEITEKGYVFGTSALIVIGLVLVACALGLEG